MLLGCWCFIWYQSYSLKQSAVINEELIGEYTRVSEDDKIVLLKLNSNSISVRLDDEASAAPLATKQCPRGTKDHNLFRGCFEDGVDRGFFDTQPDDCEGTFELKGDTLTVTLTNSCAAGSGDWKRR
jgi:hypothetical protein